MCKVAVVESSYMFYRNDLSYEFGIGALIVATVLHNHGHDVNILEVPEELCVSIRTAVDYLSSEICCGRYEIVAISTRCDTYPFAVLLAKEIKKNNEKITIIFGGPQASLTYQATLCAFPEVDIVAIGEGEITMPQLIEALEKGSLLKDVRGIAYRSGEKTVVTEPRELLCDGFYSEPNYALLPSSILDDLGKHCFVQVEAGRGCTGRCAFCCTSVMWEHQYRLVNEKSITRNLRYLNQNFSVSQFSLAHDNLLTNRNKALLFLTFLCQENTPRYFTWNCSARLDTLSEEILAKLEEAGCTQIFIGIESGSPRMQKIYSKNLQLDILEKKLYLLRQYHIKPTFSFLIGHPLEDKSDVKQTFDVIERILQIIENTVIQLHKLSPHSGSKLFFEYADEITFESINISDQSMFEYLDDESIELIKEHKDIFSSFYSFPIRNELQPIVTHLNHILFLLNVFPKTVLSICSGTKNSLYKVIEMLCSVADPFTLRMIQQKFSMQKQDYEETKRRYILEARKLVKKNIAIRKFLPILHDRRDK